jgi:hypothetical protein
VLVAQAELAVLLVLPAVAVEEEVAEVISRTFFHSKIDRLSTLPLKFFQ